MAARPPLHFHALSPPLTATARDPRPNPSLELDPAALGRLRTILLHSSRRLLRSPGLPSSHRERSLVGLGVILVSSSVEFFSYAISLLKPFMLLLMQRGAHDASPSAGAATATATATADTDAVGSLGSACLALFLAVCFCAVAFPTLVGFAGFVCFFLLEFAARLADAVVAGLVFEFGLAAGDEGEGFVDACAGGGRDGLVLRYVGLAAASARLLIWR